MNLPIWSLTFVLFLLGSLLVGCDEPPSPVAAEPMRPVNDPGVVESDLEPEAEPEPEGPPPRLYTKRWVVTVRDAPHTTGTRTGYLRSGATVQSASERLRSGEDADEDCPEGFYELEDGGFVCGAQMVPFLGDQLPERPGPQPDLEAKLPYRYGYSRRDMTPVYRRMPSDEQAAEHEGYVIPGTEPDPATEPTEPTSAPVAEPNTAPAAETVAAGESGPAESVPAGLGGEEGEAPAAPDVEEEEAPPPRLRDLQYRRGILRRHLMRGFYVSIDRPMRRDRRRYWRTLQNTYVPYAWIGEREGSEYQNNAFSQSPEGEPEPRIGVGFTFRRGLSFYVERNERLGRGRLFSPRTAFPILAQRDENGQAYLATTEDRYVRESETYFVPLPELPEGVSETEKWIDVNLERQTLIAYEGTRPVFATLISSGIVLRADVEGMDHRTPTGTFRITAKHVTKTMDADNNLQGPYSVEDVPYVQYYEGNYALHAAFWHDSFGAPKSHGCINMSPRDSNWLFGWTEPQIPAGWHGVYPAEEELGTLVRIHGETPVGRRR